MKIKTQCACVDENNTIWVYSDDFNGLFRYNLEKDELIFVNTNPYENSHTAQLYNGAVYYDGNIFFFPIYAKGIAVYNIEKNEFEIIELPQRNGIIYYNIERIDEETILLFPIVFSKYAYVLNMKYKTVFVKLLDVESNSMYINNDSLIVGSAIIDRKAYFALRYTKNIVEYDLDKNKINVFETSCDLELFSVRNKKDKLYCINIKGTKIYIIYNNKVEKTICLENVQTINDGMCYVNFTFTKQESIFCNPGTEDNFLLIDKNDEKKYVKLKEESSKEIVPPFISCVIEVDNNIIGLPYNGEYGFVYNCSNNDNIRLEFHIVKNNMEGIISDLFEVRENFVQEGNVLELVDLINYLHIGGQM